MLDMEATGLEAELVAEKMLDSAALACAKIKVKHDENMSMYAQRLMDRTPPLEDLNYLFALAARNDIGELLQRVINTRNNGNTNLDVVNAIRSYFTNRLMTHVAFDDESGELRNKKTTMTRKEIMTDARWVTVDNIVTFFRGQSDTLVL